MNLLQSLGKILRRKVVHSAAAFEPRPAGVGFCQQEHPLARQPIGQLPRQPDIVGHIECAAVESEGRNAAADQPLNSPSGRNPHHRSKALAGWIKGQRNQYRQIRKFLNCFCGDFNFLQRRHRFNQKTIDAALQKSPHLTAKCIFQVCLFEHAQRFKKIAAGPYIPKHPAVFSGLPTRQFGSRPIQMFCFVGKPMPAKRDGIAAERIRQNSIHPRVQIVPMNLGNQLGPLNIEPLNALPRLDAPGKQLSAHRPIEKKNTLLQSL